MKYVGLFFLLVLMSQSTFAEDTYYAKGLRPFLSSFSTKKIRMKGEYGQQEFKNGFNTNGALGVGIAFDWIPREGSGFTVSYQRFQPFKTSMLDENQILRSVNIAIQEIAMSYTYSSEGKNAYGFIGLNYSVRNFSERIDEACFSDANNNFVCSGLGIFPISKGTNGGGIGYQIGAGYIFNEVILEFAFKVIELNPETNHFTNLFNPSTTLSISGIIFNLGYSF